MQAENELMRVSDVCFADLSVNYANAVSPIGLFTDDDNKWIRNLWHHNLNNPYQAKLARTYKILHRRAHKEELSLT